MPTLSIDELRERHAIDGALDVREGPGGLPLVRVDTAACTAELFLTGAQLCSWIPRGHEEVLWLSGRSHFAPGEAIRGGVPLCWPWFGADPSGTGRPQHGFARKRSFELRSTSLSPGGSCRVELGLRSEAATRTLWPHDFDLRLVAHLGEELELELWMRNDSDERIVHTAALHTYFRVGEAERVRLAGFAGHDCLDKCRDFARIHQSEEPRLDGPIDRVYLDAPGETTLEDPLLERRLRITKYGSRTTVLWNPGEEGPRAMADFDEGGHRRMVCIEAANAADDEVTLQPGEEHVLSQAISVEAL